MPFCQNNAFFKVFFVKHDMIELNLKYGSCLQERQDWANLVFQIDEISVELTMLIWLNLAFTKDKIESCL